MNRVAICLSALCLVACGAKQQGTGAEVADDFDCKNRRAAYELTGGFGAHKIGVAIRCDESPKIIKFRQESPESDRKVETHAIGSAAFDKLWEKLDSTGWRHMSDCDYVGDDSDPQYVITIGDHAAEVKVGCTGKKLQFPHDQLVNELDLKAAGLGSSY